MNDKLKVAILGSGLIGTDLLMKINRSENLICTAFIGRNFNSPRMSIAANLGIKVSDKGINEIINNPGLCDIVFDATSAQAHKQHAPILKELGLLAIDLTPAKVGKMCVPAVNLNDCLAQDNVNMVTCGGQASIPLAYAISKANSNVSYIEAVSTIASRSAGPATRLNLDEYIDTTENGLKQFTNVKLTKAILILNPAQPCIDMQTTVFAIADKPDLARTKIEVRRIVEYIQSYVPGYQLVVEPTLEGKRIVVMVRVKGCGDYLPAFAGNLDIINCAAINMAERYAKVWRGKVL